MEPALRDFEHLRRALAADAVDQAVLAGDAAGPPAAQVTLERFGFAGAVIGVTAAFLDQLVEPLQTLPVGVLPVAVLGPGLT